MSFQEIPLERLYVSTQNVRKELGDISDLKASIAKEGILQPVLVRPSKEREGFYEVVVGRRRFEAARQLGLSTIPAIVKDLSDEQARLESLIENIQRQSLSPMEEAMEIMAYFDRLGSLRKVAEMLGISHTYVAEKLNLLGLHPSVEEGIKIVSKASKAERVSGSVVPTKHASIIAKAIKKSKAEALSSPNLQAEILKAIAPLKRQDVKKVARKIAEAERISPEEIGSFIEKAVKEPIMRVRGTRIVLRLTEEEREALEEAAKSRGLGSLEEAALEAIRQWLKSLARRRGV